MPGQVHAVGLAMAYKLIEAAQTCRRAVNAPHLFHSYATARFTRTQRRAAMAPRPSMTHVGVPWMPRLSTSGSSNGS